MDGRETRPADSASFAQTHHQQSSSSSSGAPAHAALSSSVILKSPGSPPPPPPAADHLMSRNAVENNSKLFPMFKQNLADPTQYLITVHKLVGWMSRDKAYYTNARPWIVEFVETAKRTVAVLGGGDFVQDFDHVSKCRNSPYLRPYMDLVAILARFRHLYDEPDLLARIDALKSTIAPLPAQAFYAAPSSSAPPPSGLPPRPPHSAMPLPPPIVTGQSAGPVSPMTPTYPTGTPVYAQPPRPNVSIPAGFPVPPPVFGGMASSPLFRAPGTSFPLPPGTPLPLSPVAGMNQGRPGSSASFRATPPVVATHPAKVAGWSTAPPPPHNIQPAASMPAPQAGPSTFTPMSIQASGPTSRGGTGSGSGSSTPGPAAAGAPQQKKEKKKKKVGAPLTFLEADLNWYVQQKRQLVQKEEPDGKVGEETGPVAQEVAVDAGSQGNAHQAAEAVPDGQDQAQQEGTQPRSEPVRTGGGHDDSSKRADNEIRVMSAGIQDSAISTPQQTHGVSQPEILQTISVADLVKDDVAEPTNQVSVDATYVAAPSHNANAEPQLAESAQSNQSIRATSAATADLRSGTDIDTAHVAQADSTAGVASSHGNIELQNQVRLDEEVEAALARDVTSITPPPVTSGSLHISTSNTSASVQQPEQWSSIYPPTSAAQAAPAPQPAHVSAAQASPIASSAFLPPAAPSSASPILSTRLSPSAGSPRLYSSTKSPFDNLAREQWSNRRSVPELKIQPVPASMVRLSASPVVHASSGTAHGSPSPAPMSGKSVKEPTPAPLSPALSRATPPDTAGQAHSGATGQPGSAVSSPVIRAAPEIHPNPQEHLNEPPKMAPFYLASVAETTRVQDDSSRSKDSVGEPVSMDVDDAHESDQLTTSDVDVTASRMQQTPEYEAVTQATELSPKNAAPDITEPLIHPTAAEDVQMSEPARPEVPMGETKADDSANTLEDQDMDLGSDESLESVNKVAQSTDVSMEISATSSSAPTEEVIAPAMSQELPPQTQPESAMSIPTPDSAEDGIQAQIQPDVIPSTHADPQASNNAEAGPIIKARDYAIQSFADGDFVYPHKTNPDNSDGAIQNLTTPSKAVVEPEHREPTPVASATPDDATALSGLLINALTRLTSAISTPPSGQEEIPLTWEVKVAYARGIPITNPPPPPDYNAVHFGESMQVIGSSRGGNSWREHLTWEFGISTELRAALQQWTDRHKTIDADVSSAKCLSASCYKYSRSLETPNVLVLRPNIWDWNMHPWLEIDNGEKIQTMRIYNFTVSEDQLLDISGRVCLGKNIIKLNYPYGTPLDWVFVLRIHDPTAPQLAEFHARRKDQLRWQKTLDDLVNFKKPSLKWPADIVPIRPRDRDRAHSQTRPEGENKLE